MQSDDESDEFFVSKIARRYKLLDFIYYDKTNDNIPKNYDYIKPKKTSGKNKKRSPHKYIADAVEAIIGAIYKETGNLDEIKELLNYWISLYK